MPTSIHTYGCLTRLDLVYTRYEDRSDGVSAGLEGVHRNDGAI